MNWNKDKSIILSQTCCAVFALALLAADVYALWEALAGQAQLSQVVGLAAFAPILHMVFLVVSGFGWAALWHMWRLLGNIRRGQLFVTENVRLMRRISWCCFAVAAVLLAAGFMWYGPMIPLSGAAAFMGLIVRIVKNAFHQAVAMQSELDLTI